jgi:ATP-binding cassette subfamily B protein
MRYVKQEGIRDCGIACLYNIIRYYNGSVSLEKLRELTHTNENGTSIYNLMEASKVIGLNAKAYRCSLNDLANLDFPMIAYIKLNNYYHFVIIKDIDFDSINIFDPIRGDVSYTIEEFTNIWQNIIITFKQEGKIVNENTYYLDYLKEEILNNKKLIIILLSLYLLVAIIDIIFSIVLKQVVTSKSISLIFIFSLFILKIFSYYINNKYALKFNNKIDDNLSSKIYKKLFSLPYSYYHNRPIGDLISKINDLYNVKEFLNLLTSSSVIDILLITFIPFIILFTSFKLLIVLIFCSTVYFLYNFHTQKNENKNLDELKESNTNNNAMLMDNVLGIDTIKNLNIENKVITNQLKSFHSYLHSYTIYNNFIIKKSTVLMIISYIPILVLLTNKYKSGDIIMLFTMLTTYFSSLNNITLLIRRYMDANLSFKRLNNLLNYEITNDNNKVIKDIQNIKLNNINYRVNNKILINNFSLNINKGDYIFISGKNGVGKSTLCKLLIKNLSIKKNNIFINDIDINDIKESSIKDNICYASQDEYIFTDSIKNNILLFKNISSKELNKVLKVTELDKMLKNKNINLDYLLEENGHNLSGGEKQKILLARILLRKTDYIILDETTSEIDIETERKILKNIQTEYKKTILFISHRDSNKDLFNKRVELKGGNYERIKC